MISPDTPTQCVSFEAKAISPSGAVTRLGARTLHGGPSPDYRVLDLDGRGLLILGSSMRGGRTVASHVVPYAPEEPAPSLVVPSCAGMAAAMPELARGASGEVVILCVDGRRDKESCVRFRAPTGAVDVPTCLRIGASSSEGRALVAGTGALGAPVLRVECAPTGGVTLVHATGSITLSTIPSLAADFAAPCAAHPKAP